MPLGDNFVEVYETIDPAILPYEPGGPWRFATYEDQPLTIHTDFEHETHDPVFFVRVAYTSD